MDDRIQFYYNIVVFVCMIFAFYKIGLNKLSFLIVLIFWSGFFDYLGRTLSLPVNIYNSYKVFIILYAIWQARKQLSSSSNSFDRELGLLFLLFSLSFWTTYLIHGGNIITMLSQYLYKYGFVYIFYLLLKDITSKPGKLEYITSVIKTVLLLQVFLSIIKLSFIGIQTEVGIYEPIVGSISSGGAGGAVIIPVMALIFYWQINHGNFNWKNWLVAISFILISIASGKRQPLILFPLILYYLFTFVKKGNSMGSFIKYIPIAFMIFYGGARLNPTFNPDHKIWGRFDFKYIIDYVIEYNFGTNQIDNLIYDPNNVSGRGAGINLMFSPEKLALDDIYKIMFGNGRYEVATAESGQFTSTHGAEKYGVEHIGLIGEFAAILYSFGYLGTLFMLLFGIKIILRISNKRLVILLFLFFLYDFIFYNNLVVYSTQSAVILLFIVFYSRQNILVPSARNATTLPTQSIF